MSPSRSEATKDRSIIRKSARRGQRRFKSAPDVQNEQRITHFERSPAIPECVMQAETFTSRRSGYQNSINAHLILHVPIILLNDATVGCNQLDLRQRAFL